MEELPYHEVAAGARLSGGFSAAQPIRPSLHYCRSHSQTLGGSAHMAVMVVSADRLRVSNVYTVSQIVAE